MKLNEIARPAGNKKAKPRKGRGPGTGNGKTAGKGHKGQKARSGGHSRAWFEGGQMPLNRRLPKRGFHNPFTVRYQVVNLRDLAVDTGHVIQTAAHGFDHDSFAITQGARLKWIGAWSIHFIASQHHRMQQGQVRQPPDLHGIAIGFAFHVEIGGDDTIEFWKDGNAIGSNKDVGVTNVRRARANEIAFGRKLEQAAWNFVRFAAGLERGQDIAVGQRRETVGKTVAVDIGELGHHRWHGPAGCIEHPGVVASVIIGEQGARRRQIKQGVMGKTPHSLGYDRIQYFAVGRGSRIAIDNRQKVARLFVAVGEP